jgi:SPP1 family predicted phage head-tail adaptor
MKLKDKKIEILAVSVVKDAEGFSTEELTPISPPLWAYFRQLSGKEIYTGGAASPQEQVLFTVNYRSDITTSHMVRYRGALYNIVRVDVFEGYKEDITLYCKLHCT